MFLPLGLSITNSLLGPSNLSDLDCTSCLSGEPTLVCPDPNQGLRLEDMVLPGALGE